MLIKNWKKEIFTVPNLLSLLRMVLIPVYMTIYLNADAPSDYFVAAAILAVSCLTDMIDGKIARKFNMISTLGKILDPIADKATQFTLIVCLAVKYPVLLLLCALFIIKEGFQLVAGWINLRKGRMLDGAMFSGKVSTTVLFVSLILMVLFPALPTTAVNVIAGIDAVFMLVSMGDYILAYLGKRNVIHDLNDADK